jgi:hypothetical protein
VLAHRTLVSHPSVPEWEQKAISGLAYRRDLYTVFAGGQEVDEIERWLSTEFEQPGLEAIDKLTRAGRLSRQDWRCILRFVAVQDLRTPLAFMEFMRECNERIPEILESGLRESVARLKASATSGIGSVPDTMAEENEFSPLIRVVVDRPTAAGSKQATIGAEVTAERRLWIAYIRHALRRGGPVERLCSHHWSVALAPGEAEWPLTDHPVVCLNWCGPDLYDFKGGWDSAGSEIMMPVSPKHLLYVQVGSKKPNRFEFPNDRARLVQRLLVLRAHRWVFATGPLDWVEQVRPRVVDPGRFAAEESAWKEWPREQLESEMSRP